MLKLGLVSQEIDIEYSRNDEQSVILVEDRSWIGPGMFAHGLAGENSTRVTDPCTSFYNAVLNQWDNC